MAVMFFGDSIFATWPSSWPSTPAPRAISGSKLFTGGADEWMRIVPECKNWHATAHTLKACATLGFRMILYCATTNAGKLREFRMVCPVEPLPEMAGIPAPEETGQTFEANAILKALYYSKHTAELLFAEDSGLEVDALHGAPGVFSARFAGPGASDRDNNGLLLEKMQDVRDRRARFVAVIALASAGQLLHTFRGVVEGEILNRPRGLNGFGYDPLFYYPPFQRTLAEVPLERKTQVSHRARALRDMLAYFKSRFPSDASI